MADFYAVVLTQPALPPFMEVARALAQARHTPALDQTVPAKRAWGILAEHQPEEVAQTLQQGLIQAGLPCRVIREDQMPSLPEAKPMTRMETPASERITLLGAAAVPHSTETTRKVKEGPSGAQRIINTTVMMSTGIPLRLGGKARVVEKTTTHTDRLFYLDIVLRNPWERRRIDAAHFDYSCLKERKSYQGFANFRLVIDDFIALAPAAALNHGIRVLQEKKPLLDMEYVSLADFERELRWRLTLLS
jgi:hypothetical protein